MLGTGSVGYLRAAVRSCVPFARIGHRGRTWDAGAVRFRCERRTENENGLEVPCPSRAVPPRCLIALLSRPRDRTPTRRATGDGSCAGYSTGHRASDIGHRCGRESGSARGRCPFQWDIWVISKCALLRTKIITNPCNSAAPRDDRRVARESHRVLGTRHRTAAKSLAGVVDHAEFIWIRVPSS